MPNPVKPQPKAPAAAPPAQVSTVFLNTGVMTRSRAAAAARAAAAPSASAKPTAPTTPVVAPAKAGLRFTCKLNGKVI
jgi:hypothetical protein